GRVALRGARSALYGTRAVRRKSAVGSGRRLARKGVGKALAPHRTSVRSRYRGLVVARSRPPPRTDHREKGTSIGSGPLRGLRHRGWPREREPRLQVEGRSAGHAHRVSRMAREARLALLALARRREPALDRDADR